MDIKESISERNPEALLADGFDEAIIGMAERINLGPVVAYSVEKIIEILMNDMEISEEELEDGETIESRKYSDALEYFEYNITGAWMGEFTPVFIEKLIEERFQAKLARDFAKADKIRDDLLANGILLQDVRGQKTTWTYKK